MTVTWKVFLLLSYLLAFSFCAENAAAKPDEDEDDLGDDDEDEEDEGKYPTDNPDVVDLNAGNFDTEVVNGVWFVKFYAPWCPHCQEMAPEWQSLAAKAKTENLGYSVAKLNCEDTQNEDICNRFSIEGYPTVFFIKEGKVWHVAERKWEEFANNVTGESYDFPKPGEKLPEMDPEDDDYSDADYNSADESGSEGEEGEEGEDEDEEEPGHLDHGPDVQELADDLLEKAKGQKWFVKFFAPWCGHCQDMAPKWKQFATDVKPKGVTAVGAVNCDEFPETCEKLNIEGYPTFYLFADGHYHEYDGDMSSEDLEKFASGGYESASKKPIPTADAPAAAADSKAAPVKEEL